MAWSPRETEFGRIEGLDPRFAALVPADARLEVLAGGYRWLEGPVWHPDGYLLFSDVAANTVYRWDRTSGVTVFLRPSGYSGTAPFAGREPGSNGLALDQQRRLILCEHGDRRVRRLETDGSRITLADRYQGQRLNSPNDVVIRSNGDLYFTDPPFGLPRTFADPARELTFSGVYRLAADGTLTLLEDGLKAPNGIAFSPDGRTLYLTDMDPEQPRWLAYDVAADGTIANRRLFFDAKPWQGRRKGAPDGLKVDREGNLFATGPEGVYVFAADGSHLGTIFTGVPTGNVAWGEDGSSLFITAETRLLRLRVTTRGAGF
jgi:gluconolactonase